MLKRRLYGSVIITYRCNAHCNMCDCFKNPSKPDEEMSLEIIKKLPEMAFTNITGGEPFIRTDIHEIVRVLYKKTNRIVVSTNGYFTERILALCDEFPNIGIRISIEGLQEANDKIRGIPDGFNRGYKTLKTLVQKGHKDIGFGCTVQDMNAEDLMPLYELSNEMGLEFATAALHNFRKNNNHINDKMKVARAFEQLINQMLQSNSPKKWFRAYFNHGLINYIYGNKRYLPCEMGSNGFFIDPFGHVMPCNGSAEPMIMGNLHDQTWDEIWHSEQAEKIRKRVETCSRNCWMIGSAAPAMKNHFLAPVWWVVKHKLKGKYSLKENKHTDAEVFPL